VEALIKRDAQGRISALFLLDMDGFKGVNDHFGHIAGDQALIRVGGQLRSILRREDLICRLGGDEFMVFLANAPDGEAVEKKAQQILALFRPSAERADVLSASVGIAVFPRTGGTLKRSTRKPTSPFTT
jgi:diguanylate cyclase (GGDEF)-like protein